MTSYETIKFISEHRKLYYTSKADELKFKECIDLIRNQAAMIQRIQCCNNCKHHTDYDTCDRGLYVDCVNSHNTNLKYWEG
jgi:hypothetical protein